MSTLKPHADAIMEAHGILNCLAWAILAPLGAILIRVIPSKKAWIIHGGFMILTLLIFTAGFGMGVQRILAHGSHVGKTAHFLLGTILFALAWAQPFIGTAHHFLYKATGKRSLLSAIHVFFGRIFMLIGVVNGGVGLLLGGNATRAEHIVYGTVVGVVWAAYVLVSLQMEVRRQEEGKGKVVGKGREGSFETGSEVSKEEQRVVRKG